MKKLTLTGCSTYKLLSKHFLENLTELHLDKSKWRVNMFPPKKEFKKLQTLSLHNVTLFELDPFNFGHLKKVNLSNYHGGSLLLEKLNLKSLKKLTLLNCGGLENSGTDMIERLKKAGCNVVIVKDNSQKDAPYLGQYHY